MHRTRAIVFLLVFLLSACGLESPTPVPPTETARPTANTTIPTAIPPTATPAISDQVEDMLEQMTLEEKIGQIDLGCLVELSAGRYHPLLLRLGIRPAF